MIALLVTLTGCGRTAHYNMGKREDIHDQADGKRGNTEWALDVRKSPNDPRIKKNIFPAGKPKCNLFVCDMLYDAGINPPLTDGKKITDNGNWPITAEMWRWNVPGWSKVSCQQKGDVVSDGKHCGIATSVNSTDMTISAGSKKVYRDNDISGTIQRYNGN